MRTLGVAALLAAGCARATTGARHSGPATFHTRTAEIQGTLVEARDYFDTGAVGGNHTFCAYLSALAEQPLGVLADDGSLVMLTSRPSRIAAHVTRTVRVSGQLTANGQLLVPSALQVKRGDTWTAAEP
jgi:hypothetical protein